jgi:phosphoglycolate phosphatase
MKHLVFDCDGTLLDTSTVPYKLFPGIKELLFELSQDYYLYVWTARGRSSTLRVLEESGVVQLFEALYTADDGAGKPHPLGLLTLVGEAPKHEILVIGDTTNDVYGAKNFGVKSLGALWNGETKAHILREAAVDFLATSVFECSKIIRQNL